VHDWLAGWLAGWQRAPSRFGVVCSAEPRPALRCGYREVGFRPRHQSGCYVVGEAQTQTQTLRGCSLARPTTYKLTYIHEEEIHCTTELPSCWTNKEPGQSRVVCVTV
jgi:hypothetical protein